MPNSEYHKQHGKKRMVIVVNEDVGPRLSKLAQKANLSQGDLVDIMSSVFNVEEHKFAIQKYKDQKIDRRKSEHKPPKVDRLIKSVSDLPAADKRRLLAELNKK